MEALMKQKREAIEMCRKLIPMMTEGEIGLICLALQTTVDRLIKEGRVSDSEN